MMKLTASELTLEQCEEVIRAGLSTFMEVGMALCHIRDNKLYRETHGTFEDYCREKWSMVASRARQLIGAAEVVANLEGVTIVTPATESQARPLAALPADQQAAAWKEAVETAPDGKVTAKHVESVVNKFNHRATNTGEFEWYTPAEYIEAARAFYGEIDLDPASCELAQAIVKAKRFFSKEDDGLQQKWSGRVWLNPPYAQPLIEQFAEKMVEEYHSGNISEGIMLTNNSTDTGWFHKAEAGAAALCFTRGRITFVRYDGFTNSPTQGQAFFYFGNRLKEFKKTFKAFGFIR